MAIAKKTVASAPKTKKLAPTPRAKQPSTLAIPSEVPLPEESGEELVVENFVNLTKTVDLMSETIAMLIDKIESMAYHVIATEEVLAEFVAVNGLNLARVNARIRAKITAGTNGTCDSNRAIDAAAAIASPLPRR